MRKLVLLFLLLPSLAFAQTQTDRFAGRGKSTFDAFTNTQTVALVGSTPSVALGNVFRTANGTTTVITNFTGGTDSQQITVICGDTFTTIQNNANIVTASAADYPCIGSTAPATFVYSLTDGKWFQVAGGGVSGGSSPGGVNGDSQCKNGSLLTACHINDDNSRLYLSLDSMFKGPNPYQADIRTFGARFGSFTVAPFGPGTTGTCTSGNPIVPVSSILNLVAGDGVTLVGCGSATALATPSAPIVVPSNASGPTGTGMDVASPACGSNYQYQIVAHKKSGGYTPASTATAIATGCPIGLQSVSITSISKTNNTATVLTSATTTISVGSWVKILGTSDMLNFAGFVRVDTVPDSTHFTYLTPTDTRNGGSAASTGGTVQYFGVNHITWPAVSGADYYSIYGRTSGSMALLGISKLQDPVGNISDPSFDDFGSTMTVAPPMPSWFPLTPPVLGAANHLTTTILSVGVGQITLANAPVSTPSSTSILVDAAPAILAANCNFTIPFSATGTIVLNSYVTCGTGFPSVYQVGGLTVANGGGIELASVPFQWESVLPGPYSVPSFSNQGGPGVFISTGIPAIHLSGTNGQVKMEGLTVTGQKNANYVTFDNSLAVIVSEVNFGASGGAEAMTMPVLIRSANFEQHWSEVNFITDQVTVSTTPALFCNSCGSMNINSINMSGRGMMFNGVYLSIGPNTGRKQGGTSPFLVIAPLAGPAKVGGVVDTPTTANTSITNYELDTDPDPLVVNATPTNSTTLPPPLTIIGGSPSPSSSFPMTSGPPFIAAFSDRTQLQDNGSIRINSFGGYGSGNFGHPVWGPSNVSGSIGQTQVNENFNFGIGGGITFGFSVPAPTFTVTSSGCGGTFPPAGTYTYQITVVGADGIESTPGPISASHSMDGSTQCASLAWTDVPGAVGYRVYTFGNLIFAGGCASTFGIQANNCIDNRGQASGSAPTLNGSGPTTIYPSLGISTNKITLSSITGGNYGKSVITGNFTANRTIAVPDATGTMALLSGAFNNNECLKANVAGGTTMIASLGLGCALTTSSLAQFAATTSAELAALISDETGSGPLVFANSPALTAPTISTSLTLNNSAEFRINTSGGYTGFKAPASVGSNLVWLLPATDSTGSQCLASNGSFVLSWTTCSGGGGGGTPGGSTTNVQVNISGTFSGSPNFTFNGSDTLTLGASGTAGKFVMPGSSSGSVTIQSQAVAGSSTALTLPNTSGTVADGASAPLVLSATTGNITCPTCTTNASALTANAIVLGSGANATTVVGSLGTTSTLLHGNAAGAPTFGPVALTTEVTGTLPFANGGTSATSRQAAINALLPGANGDVFYRDLSGNVVALPAVSAGSCFVSGPVPAWGSCSAGTITGAGSAGQLTVWNTSSSLTSSANFTYAGGILNEVQSANGLDTFTGKRFTDSAPTGSFFKFTNAAASSTLFQVDVSGAVNATSFNSTSTAAGFLGIGQGTAQSIVGNVIGITGPTSITGYNIVLPGAAGTGFFRLSNSANIVTGSFAAASGIGSCTSINNVVVALNDNSGPQCSTIAGPMFGTQAANLVFKGPNSGAAAFPTFAALVSADIPPINLNTNGSNGGVTAILGFINGGTNATSASAAFNNLSPLTNAGDLIYEVSSNVAGRLAAGTSVQVLHSGTTPTWGAVSLTADVSGITPIANGGTNSGTANGALNNLLPSQGGNAGTCLGTNGTNPLWTTCGGGGATVTPHPNFGASFSSVLTTTITGATHLMGTKNLVLACFDNSSPARAIIPASWTVDSSTFDVVVNFGVSATGYCVVNGSGPNRYATSFSGTTVTVTGATHKLATADIEVTVWDNSSPRKKIIPASVTVDTSTFDVVITFGASQSGRLVIQ